MPVYERGAHTVEEGYALYYDIVANEDGDSDGRPDPGSFGLTPGESQQKMRERQKNWGSFEDRMLELVNKMSVGGDYLWLDPETSPCHKAYRTNPTLAYARGEYQFSKVLTPKQYQFRIDADLL